MKRITTTLSLLITLTACPLTGGGAGESVNDTIIGDEAGESDGGQEDPTLDSIGPVQCHPWGTCYDYAEKPIPGTVEYATLGDACDAAVGPYPAHLPGLQYGILGSAYKCDTYSQQDQGLTNMTGGLHPAGGWKTLCDIDTPEPHGAHRYATGAPEPVSSNLLCGWGVWDEATETHYWAEESHPSIGWCPKGIMAVNASAQGWPEPWDTCLCDSDADCQSGSVCEVAYGWVDGHWEDGLWVPGHDEPQACSVPGTSTLPHPSGLGPEAYGLDSWSDGFAVDGLDITVSPEFAQSAIGGANPPILRDVHAWTRDGEITQCDPGSLCDVLGLQVGDVVIVDLDGITSVSGVTVLGFDLEHADGSIESGTLTVGAL